MKIMQVNSEKCVMCRECESACSKAWFKEESPELSRVKIVEMTGFANINICSQCGACIGVCPTQALVRDANGVVQVRKDDGLLLVHGSVPGPVGGLLEIRASIKKASS